MNRTFVGLAITTCLGCGAAPAVRDDGVSLALAPEVGARYDAMIEAEVSLVGRDIAVVETFHATYEVRAVDSDAITLHGVVLHGMLETHSGPVRLPPTTDDAPCEAELRVSRRGRLLLDPPPTGACAGTLAQPWLGGVLPDGPVHVGDAWPMDDFPESIGAHSIVVPHPDEQNTLVSSEGARAEIRWSGTVHMGPVSASEQEVSMERRVEGHATLALSDGVSREGAWEASATYTPETPDAYVIGSDRGRWCIARDGETPCDPIALPPDTRDVPAAHVYEGDACTARLASLRATLEALPIAYEHAAASDVPAVDGGAQPIEGFAPRLLVSAAELRFDGRVVTQEAFLADLGAMERNWSIVHPRTSFPHRLHVVAAPDVPLSALAPVLDAVLSTTTIDLIVATGALPELPALPTWMPPLSEDESEAADTLSAAWSAAIGGCPGAITAMGALGGMDIATRLSRMPSTMAEGLAACGCGGADVDAVEAIAARSMPRGEVSLGALVIPAGDEGPTQRVRGTVADLARTLAHRATAGSAVRLRWR